MAILERLSVFAYNYCIEAFNNDKIATIATTEHPRSRICKITVLVVGFAFWEGLSLIGSKLASVYLNIY